MRIIGAQSHDRHHGQCGACTVLVDGKRINSCLALVATRTGSNVMTIDLEEAVRSGSMPGTRFVAGFTNLVDLMKYRFEAPSQLVDLNALPLNGIEEPEDGGCGGVRKLREHLSRRLRALGS